ncbi:helix-turn-helix domain protein [Sphingomonas mucosissima]|uniref:Helix-turn-helix domain protein n=2 Tax=Sphingomonas mucosissima TaxID=370959 RepID=A0A245ZQK2_9SPHN|nr:helix-turn-helix domain protein [Sphingomonas mucosissima]
MTSDNITEPAQRRYLDEAELAERLGLSVKFLRKQRHLQLPPAYARFGRRIRYPVSEIERFEASALQPLADQSPSARRKDS